jgi:hypothetical protein
MLAHARRSLATRRWKADASCTAEFRAAQKIQKTISLVFCFMIRFVSRVEPLHQAPQILVAPSR